MTSCSSKEILVNVGNESPDKRAEGDSPKAIIHLGNTPAKEKKFTSSNKNLQKTFVGSAKSITFVPANDSVAQLVEQMTLNHWVEGSSPSGVTFDFQRVAYYCATLFLLFLPPVSPQYTQFV